MQTNSHEVIFAIVNSGYAEDAMEVAKAAGARGGTIISARGVAREKEAAFFGITLQPEKDILMMVVEKSIRDDVLNGLYKQMGMAQKAQGIVFALPVSDVAGLAMPEQKKEEAEE
jgi:nitrogen regulatory protein PII